MRVVSSFSEAKEITNGHNALWSPASFEHQGARPAQIAPDGWWFATEFGMLRSGSSLTPTVWFQHAVRPARFVNPDRGNPL